MNTCAITFAPRMPCIIASDASDPQDFMKMLPKSLSSVSSVDLKALPEHARAILKRLCFIHVEEPLLREESVAAYQKQTITETAVRFEEVFSGENRIL